MENIIITLAAYGIVKANKIEGIIVTDKIVIGEKFNNKTAGHDPRPGKAKVLYIEYTDGGKVEAKWFHENDTIYFGPEVNHCPVCSGTGKQITKISYHGQPEKDTEMEMDCIHCDNEPMSEFNANSLQKQLDKEKNMWCKCPHDNKRNAVYVPDTKKMKHHWNCPDCKKIVQIG